MSKLISRNEFRAVLKGVVRCLRGELNAPGLAPLTAEEIHFWFKNITLEDIETVNQEIDLESPDDSADSRSRLQSMLQRIREKMRRGDNTAEDNPEKTNPERGE